jgi:DNA invertase Pin-like site-specific DNA recombinase
MKTNSVIIEENEPILNQEKCAIYVRVSSDLQDYERQILELKQIAAEKKLSIPKDGVFEDKLSGYKDEYERDGLKSLMDYCLKNSIKKVLIWEISRLARKQLVLLRLVDFFERNAINIYFKKQGVWLINEYGQQDDFVGVMISVMGWYGEYEGKLMKDRFISQKKLNESIGKYNGGKIPFGYKLDEDNKYVVNEDKIDGLDNSAAGIVKEVFDLYEKGLTCSKICRICRSKGYPKIVCNTHTLARVLRDTSYIGFKMVKLGKRPTPKIINESQYNSVRDLIDINKTKADKGKKHVYLLRGILKCSYCNEYYVGKQTDDSYICPKNSGSNKANKNTSCKGGNISVSNIDGIVWDIIKDALLNNKKLGFDDVIEGTQKEIVEMNNQINQYKNLINKLEQSRKKANIIFQNDGYSVEEYQKVIKGINNEKKETEKAITVIESKLRHYQIILEESNTANKRLENIEAINDRHQMQSIIKNLVKEIVFYKITNFKTVVNILYHGGQYEWLFYNSVTKKGSNYKLSNSNYIRFDKETNQFYLLKDSRNVRIWKLNDEQKDKAIGIPMLKVLTHISKPIDPTPNATNSEIYDFDGMMSLPDIPFVLDTLNYTKLTYFKDLNKSRFNRRKQTKPKKEIKIN